MKKTLIVASPVICIAGVLVGIATDHNALGVALFLGGFFVYAGLRIWKETN
jgi:hypothetical protein